jgi:hypothetical protein
MGGRRMTTGERKGNFVNMINLERNGLKYICECPTP